MLYAGDSKTPVNFIQFNNDGTYTSNAIPKGEYKVSIDNSYLKDMAKGTVMPPGVVPPAGTKMPEPGDMSNMPKYMALPAKAYDPQKSGLVLKVEGKAKEEQNLDLTK